MTDSAPPKGTITVAPTQTGCCIRVTGRGTVRESSAARDVAARTLESGDATTVVFDLTACNYLDSTFLGMLMGLFHLAGRTTPPRFVIAAPPDVRKKLMGPCRLDRLLPFVEAPPATAGVFVPLPAVGELDPIDVSRHVMTCHRALAQVEGPMQVAFTRIADELERELAAATETPAAARS
jgi:anti-anti-sigma regulatory factor